jgi:hypothetical protein
LQYPVTLDDTGHQVVFIVTATNTAGSVTVESAPTSVVSDWVDIPGATNTVYQVVEDDLAHELRVLVTAANTATSVSAPSAAVGPVIEEVTGETGGDTVADDLGLVETRLFQRGETP